VATVRGAPACGSVEVTGIAGGGQEIVACNPGERAVSGGVSRADGGGGNTLRVQRSAPAVQGMPPRLARAGETPNAWASGIDTTSASADFTFFAVCASP